MRAAWPPLFALLAVALLQRFASSQFISYNGAQQVRRVLSQYGWLPILAIGAFVRNKPPATASPHYSTTSALVQLVFGARGLQQALADPGVTGIILSGTLVAQLARKGPLSSCVLRP